MITANIPRDLLQIAHDLEQIGTEHRKCLACHCYREVTEDFLQSVETVVGHADLLAEPLPDGLVEQSARLRSLVESTEGTHG